MKQWLKIVSDGKCRPDLVSANGPSVAWVLPFRTWTIVAEVAGSSGSPGLNLWAFTMSSVKLMYSRMSWTNSRELESGFAAAAQ